MLLYILSFKLSETKIQQAILDGPDPGTEALPRVA